MKWIMTLMTVSLFGIACTDDAMMHNAVSAMEKPTKSMVQGAKDTMANQVDKMKAAAKTATPAVNTGAANGTAMYVTPSLLNVRSGPGRSNGITRILTFKDKVNVLMNSKGWAKIGNNEYVGAQFLSSTMPTQVNDPKMNDQTSSTEQMMKAPTMNTGTIDVEAIKNKALNQ